jgi:hypothetical protein
MQSIVILPPCNPIPRSIHDLERVPAGVKIMFKGHRSLRRGDYIDVLLLSSPL